tara:strand:+ start:872 stop:1621 length:750 start_codon:yes stop_codon:yes gene_type:complete
MQKQNTTQNNLILIFIEKAIRKIPIIYYLLRSVVKFTNYFENDFFYLKKIFLQKKINIIDIGASDGISALFFLRNLNPNKIFCYEPQEIFVKKLEKLKQKYSNLIIFNYGIGLKKSKMKIFFPCFYFIYKKFFLLTYSFQKKIELQKQIETDFFFKPKIEKSYIKIRKFSLLKEKIDLIKIDTNGSEIEIIKCLTNQIKRDKPILIIENNNIKLIYNILKKYNYKKFIVNGNNLFPHKNQNNANIIFKV